MKLFDVYPLFDVNIVKGQGCKVWDDKGQEYLDLYGGHAVISIGHAHPHYIEKITEQVSRSWPSDWAASRATTTTSCFSSTAVPRPTRTH